MTLAELANITETTAIYRILCTLRFGAIHERRSILIINNKSDTIGIYLSDGMKEKYLTEQKKK